MDASGWRRRGPSRVGKQSMWSTGPMIQRATSPHSFIVLLIAIVCLPIFRIMSNACQDTCDILISKNMGMSGMYVTQGNMRSLDHYRVSPRGTAAVRTKAKKDIT